jgi:hypothetical protein
MAKFLCDGNPFFQLAQPAKRKTHVLLALVVVIAILVLSILVSGIATLLVGSLLPINREIVSGFFMFTTLILLVWLYTRFVEGRSFKTLGFARENFIPKYFRGFGVGFLLMAGSLLIITLLCDVAIEPPKIEEGVFYTIVSIVLALLFFAIQGAGEEIMFRGWLMQSVGARHWPWLGILLSIVLFMAVHLANPGVNAISIVNLLLIAIFLSVYVLREGGLWGVCGFHTAWNWSMGNIFGLEVSGNSIPGASAINMSISGHEAISGGRFGIEASLVVTGVIIIGILWLIIADRNEK